MVVVPICFAPLVELVARSVDGSIKALDPFSSYRLVVVVVPISG